MFQKRKKERGRATKCIFVLSANEIATADEYRIISLEGYDEAGKSTYTHTHTHTHLVQHKEKVSARIVRVMNSDGDFILGSAKKSSLGAGGRH